MADFITENIQFSIDFITFLPYICLDFITNQKRIKKCSKDKKKQTFTHGKINKVVNH
jgi:hypothetical protein